MNVNKLRPLCIDFHFRSHVSDSISTDNPRVIVNERAKKMANEFKHCVYYETCATYGLNVDQVFQDGKYLTTLMWAITGYYLFVTLIDNFSMSCAILPVGKH